MLSTPNLWSESIIYNIQQLNIDYIPHSFQYISEKLRLGIFVEQVIFQSLQNNVAFQIIATNIQIIENNITIGEIDCLLKEDESYIHLEIVYKFYLLDPKISKNELECWIGPNRKDSLLEKLNKLQEKQFPLLYHPKTNEYLEKLNLSPNKFNQKVCFKAQLFIPYGYPLKEHYLINTECIIGYYYKMNELDNLKDCKFYIPNKLNWINTPKQNTNWINYDTFYKEVELLINEKRSPLCFVKNKKGNLSKIFIVWWD